MAQTNKHKELAEAKAREAELATASEVKQAVAGNDTVPAERVITEDGITGVQAEANIVNATNVNTTASLKGPKSNAQLSAEVKKAQQTFKDDKKVKVAIPAVLASKLGSIMFVSVNGVSINVPVDGEDHEVPKVFADHIKQTLKDLK